jgi:hypothetical protein
MRNVTSLAQVFFAEILPESIKGNMLAFFALADPEKGNSPDCGSSEKYGKSVLPLRVREMQQVSDTIRSDFQLNEIEDSMEEIAILLRTILQTEAQWSTALYFFRCPESKIADGKKYFAANPKIFIDARD